MTSRRQVMMAWNVTGQSSAEMRHWQRWRSVSAGILILAAMITAVPAFAGSDPLVFPRPPVLAAASAAAAARDDLAQLTPATSPATSDDSLVRDLDHVAFGRVVASFDNFALVPQWRDLLRRANAEDALCRKSCGGDAWRDFISELRHLPRAAQLETVQQRLNRLPYRDDLANWQRVDYWATPRDFMRKGGDCEDYAIAKYFALRGAGWPAADLRVMLSHRRGDNIGHAYLILRSSGGWLVLDNQAAAAYQPSGPIDGLWAGYSLNETSLWIHRNSSAPDFIVSSRQ